jgi:hypothetical protein
MAKPIFLIQLNHNTKQYDATRMRETIGDRLPDWHVLVALTAVNEPTFTAFSEQGVDDIEIEKLKQMLLNQLECA